MSAKLSAFTPLILRVQPHPALRIQSSHTLYVRASDPTHPDPDTYRSIFLANVPIDSTEQNLRQLFKNIGEGRIIRVDGLEGIHQRSIATVPGLEELAAKEASAGYSQGRKKRKRTEDDLEELLSLVGSEESQLPLTWSRDVVKSGSSAVVVFADRASRDVALKAVKRATKRQSADVTWPPVGIVEESLGEKRYRKHHKLSFASKAALHASINTYLTAYTATEAAQSRAAAKARQEPDADGFITVTRGGRSGPGRLEEAEKAKAKQEAKLKKTTEEVDFYKFQGRERRKKREEDLRRQFGEEVSRLRAKRTKPS